MSKPAPRIVQLRAWHLAVLAAWIVLGVWLIVTGPSVLCDLDSGRRARGMDTLLCSPTLLVQGPKGVALFFWMVGDLIAVAAFLISRRRSA